MQRGLSNGGGEPRHQLGAAFLKPKPSKPLNCFSAALEARGLSPVTTKHSRSQASEWAILCLRPLCSHYGSEVFYNLKIQNKWTSLLIKEGNRKKVSRKKWKKEKKQPTHRVSSTGRKQMSWLVLPQHPVVETGSLQSPH